MSYESYIKRQRVRATLICGPGQYSVSWGAGTQTFDRAHLRLEMETGNGCTEVYGCALDVFVATYVNADELGVYRKATVTMARVAMVAFVHETQRNGERTRVGVEAGDYLVREADGSGEYHVAKGVFEATYEPSPSESDAELDAVPL